MCCYCTVAHAEDAAPIPVWDMQQLGEGRAVAELPAQAKVYYFNLIDNGR